jgi:RecQ-mediated genome instability protein 1
MQTATPAASNMNDATSSITSYLTLNGLPPTSTWLDSFTSSVRPSTPLVALQKTALFRMTSSDLQKTVDKGAAASFPADISDPGVKERILRDSIAVQVLDIEDIGRSRWSQFEAIEAQERGETTKGQEVIRVLPDENQNPDSTTTDEVRTSGPHKLLLQDARGTQVYGLELSSITGGNVPLSIGTKLLLKNAVVARGVILLEPKCVEMLGGKVDAWDKKWRDERKARLKAAAGVVVAS